ncbi:restriction endonuclease subunit S [Vibrio mediterranei]|uniref:restriction endonuclease subunit S n=1 Tax=Vibrio mediterranei TaxID=689 RepID=UPI0017FD9D67|nr:restriction endonuclease subunit S [Vibrio mediterranei]NUW71951.1 restriction endonuclease subunit S [Vibrio mediterranei]
MSELPSNWKEVKWNDITGIDGFRRGPFGGNLKKSCFVDEGFAVYEQYAPINNDCSSFRYFITTEKYEELSGFQVQGGDFLISCSGTMGKITFVPEEAPKGVINQALLRIRLQDKFIDSDYFLRLFKSPQVQSLVLNKSVGGAIQNLAAVKELKEIPLPIAPLAEQKRIVEKLDDVLAQVDTIKARLDGIPDLLKRFRQSVLASAVSGKLTEEWSGDKNDRMAMSLKSMTTKIGSGSTPKGGQAAYKTEGIPLVRSMNIHSTFIKYDDLAFIDEAQAEKLKNVIIDFDDVLLNITGASIGRVNLAPECFVGGRVNQHVSIIRCNPSILLPRYLHIYLASPKMQKWIEGENYGATRQALTKSMIESLELIPPPVEEQKEIVRQVDQYFAFADTIEAQVKKAQARVDNLTQSILAKAFRGELVPQDPNDEPADKLLERIAEARKEAEALAKTAKKAENAKKRAAKKAAENN